jgi:pyridinium-3,5-bisthiocarboxylic acid mononucleotide nickel chelatase
MDIHLDLLGGIAGDMFAAALLDAFPEHEAGARASVAAVSGAVACRAEPHGDGTLVGRRFVVEAGEPERGHHHHRHWASIRADLERAPLADAVRTHALAIFGHLAAAEARVHGVAPDEVTFHEVGAWDSIADVVAAAHLIDACRATGWSASPVPLGGGRVRTAHGWLPVPAPATALLLEGLDTVDDGIGGERATPTGAAILRHLCGGGAARAAKPRRLVRSGIGFGTRRLEELPNVVRALVFAGDEAPAATPHRELGVIEFEVDDQSPEDLAMGLERLRAHPDIFDAVQMPVFGKKGRMAASVRLLARASAMGEAIEAAFRETTTIGLRHHVVAGATLARRSRTVEVGPVPVRVKLVDRPGGATAKAEADDALAHEGHARRAALRAEAERRALEGKDA